jgi:hypothetical protein
MVSSYFPHRVSNSPSPSLSSLSMPLSISPALPVSHPLLHSYAPMEATRLGRCSSRGELLCVVLGFGFRMFCFCSLLFVDMRKNLHAAAAGCSWLLPQRRHAAPLGARVSIGACIASVEPVYHPPVKLSSGYGCLSLQRSMQPSGWRRKVAR